MFLGAVAKPRPKYGFDGKIGMWVIGRETVAKKRSKYFNKGDVKIESVTIDTAVFFKRAKIYLFRQFWRM